MKVKLMTYTNNAKQILSAAAKLCYSSSSIDDIMSNLDEENMSQFIKMLSDLGHESPTEHISFTFGIEGVSRSFLAQITRHRIASYSVQSQRYVRKENFDYVIPLEIKKNPQLKKLYDHYMDFIRDKYTEISDKLKKIHMDNMIKEGIDYKTSESKAEKMAIEDARFLLPNACDTKMVVTMNARSLNHFFELRCCNRAQWEIRAVANEMLSLVKKVMPQLFSNAGPSCLRGKCPEGKMSCGNMEKVQKYYL